MKWSYEKVKQNMAIDFGNAAGVILKISLGIYTEDNA